MTHITTTKEGTEIYREPESHLTKDVTYRIIRRKNGTHSETGLTWRQIEKIMIAEKLHEPLKDMLK